METMAIAPEAIARAIALAIEQPEDVDVGEIVVRPTAKLSRLLATASLAP